MKYLGIDIGSSFIKAVLLDLDQYRMISTRKSRSSQKEKNCDPNIFEIPAEEMVDTVRTLINGYTSEYKDIQGVLISTQMHGFVYSVPGRKDMYVSWQDMRCMNPMEGYEGSYLEFLQEQISPEDMQENGVYLKPSLGICNLYAMLQADKSLPGDGKLYTLGSYLIHALTGNNICHVMNAAPMGIVNVKQHSLDYRIMTLMGMERVQLPVLAEDDYQICGTYRSNGCELKIHPDYGDMQVAILGSGVQSGDAVANVATGAQVIRHAEDFHCGSYEIRPYFEKGYLYTISNMPAGRNLDVLVKFISECAGLVTGKEPDMGIVYCMGKDSYVSGGGRPGTEGGSIFLQKSVFSGWRLYIRDYTQQFTYWQFIYGCICRYGRNILEVYKTAGRKTGKYQPYYLLWRRKLENTSASIQSGADKQKEVRIVHNGRRSAFRNVSAGHGMQWKVCQPGRMQKISIAGGKG